MADALTIGSIVAGVIAVAGVLTAGVAIVKHFIAPTVVEITDKKYTTKDDCGLQRENARADCVARHRQTTDEDNRHEARLQTLELDVAVIKQDVAEVKTGVATINTNISWMRGDMERKR